MTSQFMPKIDLSEEDDLIISRRSSILPLLAVSTVLTVFAGYFIKQGLSIDFSWGYAAAIFFGLALGWKF